MRHFTLFSLILLSIMFFSCNETVTHTDNSNSIQGYIIDENENPVEGMQIHAINSDNISIESDTTNKEGFFMLVDLPDSLDNINILMRHNDYKHRIIPALEFLSSFNDRNQYKFSDEFLEEDCCNYLKVNVMNESEEPLDSVEVRLNKGEDVIGTLYSNSEGSVEFDSLCDGNYWFRVYDSRFNVREIEISLDNCDSLTKNVILTEKSSCCNSVKFTVYNPQEEKIENAEIKLRQNGNIIGVKFTNENGIVEFDSLCDGEYDFRIYKEGFIVKEDDFGVDDCEDKEISVMLQSNEEEDCCNEFELTVLDGEENAVENAKVRLFKGEELIGTMYSNSQGKVLFDSLCDGNYWSKIEKEGFLLKTIEFGVDNCEKYSKTIILQSENDCCNDIKIIVKDSENNRIENVEVKLRNEGFQEIKYTNADGIVVFDSLCDGKYEARIYKEGYKVIEYLIRVEDCESKIEDFVLEAEKCCNNILKVYPKDSETGEIITGSKVRLWQNGEKIEVAVTGENAAIIDGICEGSYWVDIIAEGYEDIEFEVSFDCDEVKEIVKELIADDGCCDGSLKLFIKDAESGEYITSGYIKLWKNGEVIKEKEINGDGFVYINELCEGEYGVDIFVEGYQHKEFTFALGCNENKEMTKEIVPVLCCNNKAYFIPKDSESGEVINGAIVKLWKNGEVIRQKTVENGSALMKEICKGNYVVSISAEGYETIEFELSFDCEETKEIVKEMD
jgi:hypothetical protein